ncbi:MAG: PAS domain S-box protein [Myxococcales bacterium]|nr:PAS domain S-box protein [Myxococcales bacterium]
MGNDDTNRLANEGALSGEAFALRIMNSLFAFVGVLGVDGTLIDANRAPLEAAGIEIEEVRGKKFWDCYWWSYAEDVRERLRDACGRAAAGEVVRYDAVVRMRDDTRMTIDFQVSPLRDAAGRVSHLIPTAVDITERVRAEEELRESERRAQEAARRAKQERQLLDAVLEAAPAGIIVADVSGRLLRFNHANELLWGPAPFSENVEAYREWKGWWADQSSRHGRLLEPHEWAMSRALRGETVRDDVVSIEPFDKPGTRRTMLNSGAPVRDAEGNITGAVVAQMNVSALVAAETALRESESLFRALADNIAQLAWMTDETGYIHWYNRRWYEFTGTTLEEMKGWGWQKVHHPEHLARVLEKFRRHLVLGEPWEDTFPLRRWDGEYRWFLSRAFPLCDESGRVVSWFGTNTDITAQRDAEQALREADRRKDEFIAILAHELRNPLAPVRTAVEILRRLAPDEPRISRARDAIDRQVSHMARLIDDLLDVSRISRGKLALKKGPCDVSAVARQMAEDYRPGVEAAGLTLSIETAGSPVWVEGDPVRLGQMVGNLLHNAIRFTEPGGRVEVRVQRNDADGLALVSVTDSGVGIDPLLLSRLFDPFSQGEQDIARSKGGLGLGLALTKGLAELHGGGVAARSEGRGLGSTFTLRLPLSRSRQLEAPLNGARVPRGEPLRILLVEDNADAAEMLGSLLELQGHDVRVAYEGVSAVEMAREFLPEVVISDLGLPGELDGYAVARAIREMPELASSYLIALSGYASEDTRRRAREAGFHQHFAKPASIGELERALRDRRQGAPGSPA